MSNWWIKRGLAVALAGAAMLVGAAPVIAIDFDRISREAEKIPSKPPVTSRDSGAVDKSNRLQSDFISEDARQRSESSNDGKDKRNSCLAQTKHSDSWCYQIKNDDAKNSCLAQTKYGDGWCYQIKSDDEKNSCLAQTKYGDGWCYQIKNDDDKNSCLAQTKYGDGWCYQIKNEDEKNSCLAQTKYGESWCYQIKS